MDVRVQSGEAAGLDEAAVTQRLRDEVLSPHGWGNGPGDEYGWHEHTYQKVLYCVQGGIVFHTRDGDLPLSADDRMELPAHTQHPATVGPNGRRCVEAPRHRGGQTSA